MSPAGVGRLGAAGGPGGGRVSVEGGGDTAERTGGLGDGAGEPAGSPGEAGGRLVACGRRGPGGRRGRPRPFAGLLAVVRLRHWTVGSVTGDPEWATLSGPARGFQGRPWPAEPPLLAVLWPPGESPPSAAVLFVLL